MNELCLNLDWPLSALLKCHLKKKVERPLHTMLCDAIAGDIMNKCLLTPEWEPTADQSKDTTNIQLGDPVRCIGFTYRNK